VGIPDCDVKGIFEQNEHCRASLFRMESAYNNTTSQYIYPRNYGYNTLKQLIMKEKYKIIIRKLDISKREIDEREVGTNQKVFGVYWGT
jgi:hypothetical protein